MLANLRDLLDELAQRVVAKCAVSIINNTSFADIINITDKGVLTGVHMTFLEGANAQGYIKVIIDGVTVMSGANVFAWSSPATNQATDATLSFNHRFNTSLQVQAKCGGAYASYNQATYTID